VELLLIGDSCGVKLLSLIRQPDREFVHSRRRQVHQHLGEVELRVHIIDKTERQTKSTPALDGSALSNIRVLFVPHRLKMFDPTTNHITHWPEGELAAHEAVTLKITVEQADEAEKDTWVMPKNKPTADEDGGNIDTVDLGRKTIEGVLATGSRTTILRNQGQAGNFQLGKQARLEGVRQR
jgi:hypothetical protein